MIACSMVLWPHISKPNLMVEQEVMMSYMSKHYSPAQVALLTKVTSGMFAQFADCIAQDIALPTLKKPVRQLEDEACRSPSMG